MRPAAGRFGGKWDHGRLPDRSISELRTIGPTNSTTNPGRIRRPEGNHEGYRQATHLLEGQLPALRRPTIRQIGGDGFLHRCAAGLGQGDAAEQAASCEGPVLPAIAADMPSRRAALNVAVNSPATSSPTSATARARQAVEWKAAGQSDLDHPPHDHRIGLRPSLLGPARSQQPDTVV